MTYRRRPDTTVPMPYQGSVFSALCLRTTYPLVKNVIVSGFASGDRLRGRSVRTEVGKILAMLLDFTQYVE